MTVNSLCLAQWTKQFDFGKWRQVQCSLGHSPDNDWDLSVAFSYDDKYVASGSRNSEIRIWDVEQGRTMHDSPVLRGHDVEINSVTFSSNDEHLILGSDDHKVIWNVHSDASVAGLFYCHSRYFYTILISIDSKYVIAGTGDDAV